ncbi:MAG: hypothetical protein AB1679_34700 [Actinomycetota bacterium]
MKQADPMGEGDGRLPLPHGVSRREATALARRYRAGESIVALAASTGIGAKRVSAALRSVGVVPTVGRMTLLPRRVLVDGYLRRGQSADALAAELGCSSQKVRDDLRRHGLTLRPQAQTAPGLDALGDDGLRRLYVEERLSLAEIGERAGCSRAAVGKRLRQAGITARPRGGRARPLDESDVADRLRDLYVERGLSVLEVARRLGRSRDWVIARLDRYGLPRRGWQKKPRPALPAARLRRLWVDERRSVPEVAEHFGVPADWVRAELARHAIRRPRRPPRGLTPLTATVLEDLYVRRGLTAAQIAGRVGGSPTRVVDALERAGIPRRPRGRRPDLPELSRDLLVELYVDQGLSSRAIAARVGGSDQRVLDALHRHGIPVRPRRQSAPPPAVKARRLRALYVDEQRSEAEIAALYGTNAWQVRQQLRDLGIRRPVSPPHPPPVPRPPRAVLEDLYVTQGLDSQTIARQFRTSPPVVRAWLRQTGIPVAPRTTRATRTDLPATRLEELYVGQAMTIAEVADTLEVSHHVARRALHDHGIPVRRGGPPSSRGQTATQLLAELYGDPDVAALLARHGIPARPQPGPIAARFPQAVPLQEAFLRDAYTVVGLSSRHIELLTGQPSEQILDALHAAGIPVRTNRGLSPWQRHLLAELRRRPRSGVSCLP